MKDNFWIGTLVGFLSALLGAAIMAWLQYVLRIREHEYKRKQGELDRQKEQRDREAAEREAIIALLSDVHGNVETMNRFQRVLSQYSRDNQFRASGFRGILGAFSYGDFPENDLRTMNLTELRTMHAIATGVISAVSGERAERQATIAALREIFSVPEIRHYLKQKLGPDSEHHSLLGAIVLRWCSSGEFEYESFEDADLAKLKLLYALALSNVSSATAVKPSNQPTE